MISQIQNDLIDKKYSVSELIESYLKKNESLNNKLNVFITIDSKGARLRAKYLDKQLKQFTNIRQINQEYPLFGIPIAHKDIYSTKGIETTAASHILRGYIPPYDATVVARAHKAGVIMLGKLNCDAFAHGASGENSDYGPVKNPYDLTRIPGGSSSGSGVAVITEMCVVGTGTDTGGSLRLPASFTNTVAIKPTYGRVSRYGIIAMASSADSIGHITKTVEDNARYLSITAGLDPYDATTASEPVSYYQSDIKKGVKDLIVGVPKEYYIDSIDPIIRQTARRALAILEKQGAKIVEVSLPHTEYAISVYYIVVPSEVSSNLGRFDGIRYGHMRSSFGAEAKRRIMIGTYALSSGYYDAYYLKAQKVRTLIKQDFTNVFKKVDVLLAPLSPMMPPKIGENVNDPIKMYLMDVLLAPVNLAGLPALAVPAGFSEEGLPIGVQIIGNYFQEERLYQTGFVLEQELKMQERNPEL